MRAAANLRESSDDDSDFSFLSTRSELDDEANVTVQHMSNNGGSGSNSEAEQNDQERGAESGISNRIPAPVVMVNYDKRNEDDKDYVFTRINQIKVPYNEGDLKFWFLTLEGTI